MMIMMMMIVSLYVMWRFDVVFNDVLAGCVTRAGGRPAVGAADEAAHEGDGATARGEGEGGPHQGDVQGEVCGPRAQHDHLLHDQGDFPWPSWCTRGRSVTL